jgi:hypothetical protein
MESELQCRIPCSRSACGGGAQLRRPQGIELTNRRLPAMSEASSKETSGVTKAVRSRWLSTGASWKCSRVTAPGSSYSRATASRSAVFGRFQKLALPLRPGFYLTPWKKGCPCFSFGPPEVV